ncbi:phosphatase PAP2 family protein [Gordonia sp. CPCC 205515]|uniref:phosphatase PAP2 family protein n=1 Tax=Gordonia sp. CPCC 205515 TaxID=3140791 RepID=UPI003AF40494
MTQLLTPSRRVVAVRATAIAAVSIALAALVYYVAVQTSFGQLVDQKLFDLSRRAPVIDVMPAALNVEMVSNPALWILGGLVVIVAAQIRVGSASRSSAGRIVPTLALLAFPPVVILIAQFLRDHVLLRPSFHDWIAETVNSAPSGHAAAVTAFAVVLVRAVPPQVRPLVIAATGAWAAVIEFGVLAVGWHRLSDVVISTLLVGGLGALLPDPHRGSGRALPILTALGFLGVVVGAPLAVAMYYPAPEPVAVAAVIAFVVATMLVVGAPRTQRVMTAPAVNDYYDVPTNPVPSYR